MLDAVGVVIGLKGSAARTLHFPGKLLHVRLPRVSGPCRLANLAGTSQGFQTWENRKWSCGILIKQAAGFVDQNGRRL